MIKWQCGQCGRKPPRRSFLEWLTGIKPPSTAEWFVDHLREAHGIDVEGEL